MKDSQIFDVSKIFLLTSWPESIFSRKQKELFSKLSFFTVKDPMFLFYESKSLSFTSVVHSQNLSHFVDKTN